MKVKLDEGAFTPKREHKTDAGLDLRSPISIKVPAKGSVTIDTGVHVELPYATVGLLQSKSGLMVKNGLISDGTIDEGYTGSIKVKLFNHSEEDYYIFAGDKITQLVVVGCYFPDIEIVDELKETDRGDNGIGSTGK